MASLRALQLPPAPKLDFLHLRYRPNLRTLAARWQRPVSLAANPMPAPRFPACWCAISATKAT